MTTSKFDETADREVTWSKFDDTTDRLEKWLKSRAEDPWHNYRKILIILTLVLLVGICLIGLSMHIENDHWSHIVAEFGIVLAAFSVVDVVLHTFLEAVKDRPTKEEEYVRSGLRWINGIMAPVRNLDQTFDRNISRDVRRDLTEIRDQLEKITKKLEYIDEVRDPARNPPDVVEK